MANLVTSAFLELQLDTTMIVFISFSVGFITYLGASFHSLLFHAVWTDLLRASSNKAKDK
jgi:hypothetical protein